jgi:hypothetical protein
MLNVSDNCEQHKKILLTWADLSEQLFWLFRGSLLFSDLALPLPPGKSLRQTRASAFAGRFVDVSDKLGVHFRQQASPDQQEVFARDYGFGSGVVRLRQ